MARGYPDFFGRVSVPNWGVPNLVDEIGIVVAAHIDDVLTISSRGFIERGFIRLNTPIFDLAAATTVIVTVDGLAFDAMSIGDMVRQTQVGIGWSPIRALYFVDSENYFIGALDSNIAFADSLVITLTNGQPADDLPWQIQLLWREVL